VTPFALFIFSGRHRTGHPTAIAATAPRFACIEPGEMVDRTTTIPLRALLLLLDSNTTSRFSPSPRRPRFASCSSEEAERPGEMIGMGHSHSLHQCRRRGAVGGMTLHNPLKADVPEGDMNMIRMAIPPPPTIARGVVLMGGVILLHRRRSLHPIDDQSVA
jgi:hypothetical protein